jgi:S-adenosylmethionine:tRNA ribosyltransferase-isomerase
LRLDDYDFILPEHLIAQAPIRPRDAARMLVVCPDGVEDRGVRDLPALLGPGDVMVVNDTRVIPARLHARRGQARVEIMLNRHEEAGIWHALIRNARRLKAGDELQVEGAEDCTARVLDDPEGGAARLDFGPDQARLAAALEKAGRGPSAALYQPPRRPNR